MAIASSTPTIEEAIALHQAGRSAEAEHLYRQILEREPDHAESHHRLSVILFQRGALADAIRHINLALEKTPDDPSLYNNRGVMLRNMGRLDDALANYDQAIALKPDNADAFNNRGVALADLNRLAAALASYDRAIALKPDYAEPYNNRGNILKELRRFDEAIASYEQAIAIRPDFAEAHFNEAYCSLLIGDFARGWETYEWRWKTRKLRPTKRNFAEPCWSGNESIAGKTVLLHAEQGLGDTIQFSRYAAMVAARGAEVIVEVQPQLKRLLSGLAGAHQVLAQGEALPRFDFHCPLLSLPRAFATRLDTIPMLRPLLPVPPALVKKWEARLGARDRPRVGLAWSGNTAHENDANRSIPLGTMLALTTLPIAAVSVQPDIAPQDQTVLSAHGAPLAQFGPELSDFLETAALLSLMDAVVTVDTAVAHLACSLGRPTWILLPFTPDWRWLLEREDSPWYPTARLLRQPYPGDWDSVLRRAVDEIRLRAPP